MQSSPNDPTAPTPSGGNATPDLLTLLKRRDRAWADLQGNPDSYDAMASWEMHDDALRAALLAARRESEEAKQERARVLNVHLRRHRRLAAALGLDDGYSADATIDQAIRRLGTLKSATKRALAFADLLGDESAKDGTDRVLVGIELVEELAANLRAALAATPEEK